MAASLATSTNEGAKERQSVRSAGAKSQIPSTVQTTSAIPGTSLCCSCINLDGIHRRCGGSFGDRGSRTGKAIIHRWDKHTLGRIPRLSPLPRNRATTLTTPLHAFIGSATTNSTCVFTSRSPSRRSMMFKGNPVSQVALDGECVRHRHRPVPTSCRSHLPSTSNTKRGAPTPSKPPPRHQRPLHERMTAPCSELRTHPWAEASTTMLA